MFWRRLEKFSGTEFPYVAVQRLPSQPMNSINNVVVLTALALFVGSSLPVAAQDSIAFETLEHDFGSIQEGDQPSHTFHFTNASEQDVRLVSVRPSCGCTTPSYTNEGVAPGASGEIVVEYNSTGRPGDFRKSIAVEVEGAETELLTLYITGTVIPTTIQNGVVQGSLIFDADQFSIGSVDEADAVQHTFKMQNNGAEPLRIASASSFREGVTIVYPERPIFPGEIVELQVIAGRAEDVANSRGFIDVPVVLQTDDEDQPTKSLRVHGQIAVSTASGGTR